MIKLIQDQIDFQLFLEGFRHGEMYAIDGDWQQIELLTRPVK